MIYGIALLDPNFCKSLLKSCSNLSFCRSIHLFFAEKSTILTWEDTPSSPFQGFPQVSPGFSPGLPHIFVVFPRFTPGPPRIFGLSKVSVFTQMQPNPSASSLLMMMGLVLLGQQERQRFSWENHGKIVGKSWTIPYKWRFQWEKSWENQLKMEVYWENPRTIAEWVSSAPR